MTWTADLAELAEKAISARGSWESADADWDLSEAVDALSPERIRALCELAETALAHQYGDATVYDLRERLDAIEALEKEEA